MNGTVKRIEDLKFIIEFPKYFITNYFQNLKNEIDTGFVRELNQEITNDSNVKENWLKMINLIEEYENECLTKLNSKTIQTLKSRLKIIESSTSNYTLNESDVLLTKEQAKIQQTLLLNKSYHFLDKFKFKDLISDKKLIIINNDFLSTHAINMLKCNQNDLNDLTLNEDYIKAKELKKKLINLNDDILTIDLNLSSKQSLDFFHNQIKSIEAFTFYDLKNLQSLYLNNNSLISIDSNLFVSLVNLKQLYLFENKITSISVNSFLGLINLEWLNLSKNHISKIESGSFQKLTKLKRLYLQNNELKSINENTFQGLKNLEVLILLNNQISSIHSNSFCDLIKLKEIDLSNNLIKSIDLNLFDDLKQLNLLYFYSDSIDVNQLKMLLAKYKQLNTLYLDFIHK